MSEEPTISISVVTYTQKVEAEIPPKYMEGIWSGVISIPRYCNVMFRYFVGIVFKPDEEKFTSRQVIVRQWETNLNPRVIHKEVVSNNQQAVEPDIFGLYDSCKMTDRGWLTTETVVQFKLFENPIQFWKYKYEGRKVHIKLTPLMLSKGRTLVEYTPTADIFEESMDTQDAGEERDKWPVTEIAVMNENEWEFRLQEQFGRAYNPNDCIIFSVSMHFPEAVLLPFCWCRILLNIPPTFGTHDSGPSPVPDIGASEMLPFLAVLIQMGHDVHARVEGCWSMTEQVLTLLQSTAMRWSYEVADFDAFKPGIYLLSSKKQQSVHYISLVVPAVMEDIPLGQQALPTLEWGPQTFQAPLTQQLMTQVIEDLLTTGILEEGSAYMMDYYMYSSCSVENNPPYHIGFSYILPSMMSSSEGQAIVPITSRSHRPIGQLKWADAMSDTAAGICTCKVWAQLSQHRPPGEWQVKSSFDYLVVHPISGYECDMSVSYSRVWKKTWQGLDVGHRGLGTSFKLELAECSDVRENTIASLKNAASAGADLVEFDVQLSKDLIPVLYHDFHVCIAMKHKKQLAEHDMLELPVKDLTLEQLQHLKVYHLAEGKNKSQRFFDEDLEEHQPFPTLHRALDSVDPHVGFNIEIKWTMQLKDGTYELNHPFDLNIYLDTILKVVLHSAGSRKIIFSCFHPDICTMLRLKQNKYPVIFLTQGVTKKYPPYRDPRTQTMSMAVNYAISTGILGINAHTEDILRDTTQVKMVMDAGLIIFCWGDDNNNPATIKHLKQLGIHGVIYDKIDKYSSKEVKESIFLVEAREMQNQLLKAAEELQDASQSPLPSISLPPTSEFELDDVENAQKRLSAVSAASVLSA